MTAGQAAPPEAEADSVEEETATAGWAPWVAAMTVLKRAVMMARDSPVAMAVQAVGSLAWEALVAAPQEVTLVAAMEGKAAAAEDMAMRVVMVVAALAKVVMVVAALAKAAGVARVQEMEAESLSATVREAVREAAKLVVVHTGQPRKKERAVAAQEVAVTVVVTAGTEAVAAAVAAAEMRVVKAKGGDLASVDWTVAKVVRVAKVVARVPVEQDLAVRHAKEQLVTALVVRSKEKMVQGVEVVVEQVVDQGMVVAAAVGEVTEMGATSAA